MCSICERKTDEGFFISALTGSALFLIVSVTFSRNPHLWCLIIRSTLSGFYNPLNEIIYLGSTNRRSSTALILTPVGWGYGLTVFYPNSWPRSMYQTKLLTGSELLCQARPTEEERKSQSGSMNQQKSSLIFILALFIHPSFLLVSFVLVSLVSLLAALAVPAPRKVFISSPQPTQAAPRQPVLLRGAAPPQGPEWLSQSHPSPVILGLFFCCETYGHEKKNKLQTNRRSNRRKSWILATHGSDTVAIKCRELLDLAPSEILAVAAPGGLFSWKDVQCLCSVGSRENLY